MKINRIKNCKVCGGPFQQMTSLHVCCTALCSVEWAKRKREAKEKKDWTETKKVIKDKLKTRSEWLKEVQVIFNEYIRLRDKGLPCISCGNNNEVKWNAGHYRSVGGNPELRFHELNVHKQCEHCNTYRHGNLIEYRKGLVNRIGIEQIELLEGPQEPKHYSIPELIELKVIYKEKIKSLKLKTY